MKKEQMNEALDEKQKDILLGMGKRKTVLFIRGFTKVYSKMCMDCRIKAHNNSNTPLSEYCNICRGKMERLIDKYQ